MNGSETGYKRAVRGITSAFGTGEIEGAVILGSGLSGISEEMAISDSADYRMIDGLSRPTVSGHQGRLYLTEGRILLFAGRRHLYEGVDPHELGTQVRIAAELGAGWICSFCAVGSLRQDWGAGTFVAITDHINLTGTSPLIGIQDAGNPFPSLSRIYQHSERDAVLKSLSLERRGVYAYMTGPQYETPAESRLLGMLGADVVGMSLVPEMIVAAEQNLKAFAFGCVTNHAPGIGTVEDADHQTVVRNARHFNQDIVAAIDTVAGVMKRD